MADALADTSIFIAHEAGRPLGAVPDGDVRICAATLTELGVGVLLACDEAVRQGRVRTLGLAQRFVPLAYDVPVAHRLASMLAALRAAQRRVGLFDAIIAATAAANGLAVWTQDADFELIAQVAGGPPVILA